MNFFRSHRVTSSLEGDEVAENVYQAASYLSYSMRNNVTLSQAQQEQLVASACDLATSIIDWQLEFWLFSGEEEGEFNRQEAVLKYNQVLREPEAVTILAEAILLAAWPKIRITPIDKNPTLEPIREVIISHFGEVLNKYLDKDVRTSRHWDNAHVALRTTPEGLKRVISLQNFGGPSVAEKAMEKFIGLAQEIRSDVMERISDSQRSR